VIADVVTLMAANACFLAAGIGVGGAAGVWQTRRDLLRSLGVSYIVGVACVGVLASLLLVAGVSLHVWQLLLVCGLLFAGVLRRRGALLGAPLPAGPRGLWVVRATTALLTAYLAALGIRDALKPLVDWDSWAIWTMKARALVLLGGLDPGLFGGSAYRPLHLDYPPLYPALEAIDFRFMGDLNTQVIHLQAWVMLVGFVLAVLEILRERVPPVLLWPLVAMLATAPSLARQVGSGSADASLAMMFALAALTAWLYVDEGDRRWAVLLAVFAAAAAATKQEGSLFAPLLVVATLAFARQSGRPLRPVLTAGGFLVASMVPWLIWIRVHHAAKTNGDVPIGKSVDPGYLLDRLDRLPVAVHEMTRQAVRPSSWILILPLAVILSVVALRSKQQRRLATFTLAVLVVSTAPVLWAYWVGRPEIHWYVTHSARRTVTSAVLAAGVLLPLLTEQFAGRTPTAGSADDAARVSQRGRHPRVGAGDDATVS
jgi:hypothetical protein